MGKPVHGSRGPAWFNPKPRREVPPPAKRRSGRGINWPVEEGDVVQVVGMPLEVLPNGCSTPKRTERAKTKSRPNEVYVEFCSNPRKKSALDPSAVEAMLRSSVLKLPCFASLGLSRRSRA